MSWWYVMAIVYAAMALHLFTGMWTDLRPPRWRNRADFWVFVGCALMACVFWVPLFAFVMCLNVHDWIEERRTRRMRGAK